MHKFNDVSVKALLYSRFEQLYSRSLNCYTTFSWSTFFLFSLIMYTALCLAIVPKEVTFNTFFSCSNINHNLVLHNH